MNNIESYNEFLLELSGYINRLCVQKHEPLTLVLIKGNAEAVKRVVEDFDQEWLMQCANDKGLYLLCKTFRDDIQTHLQEQCKQHASALTVAAVTINCYYGAETFVRMVRKKIRLDAVLA